MKIQIEVTAEDIAKGQAGNSFACPLARAVKRITNRKPKVNLNSIWFFREEAGNFDGRPLPEAARAFVIAFDFGETPDPFTFELDLPEELLLKDGNGENVGKQGPPEGGTPSKDPPTLKSYGAVNTIK